MRSPVKLIHYMLVYVTIYECDIIVMSLLVRCTSTRNCALTSGMFSTLIEATTLFDLKSLLSVKNLHCDVIVL